MDVVIRAVDDPESCRLVEDLQRRVWGFNPDEVVPYHQLMTAARWGGMVLLAFDGDQPVGFCYGFVGMEDGQPVICSHMLAVLPSHRSRNVGYRLKLAQRDLARERGIYRIVWTFDPLEARNAYLNLHKLGAFVERYYINHYGEMQDDLNRGLPSDRLLADWRFGPGEEAPQRARPDEAETAPLLNPARDLRPRPRPGDFDPEPLGQAPWVRVAVPAQAGELRRADPETALAWRLNVRQALTTAFKAGYRAVDVARDPAGDLAYYILTLRR